MIGLVLATHGQVAPAMLQAAEAIVGPLEHVTALSLEAGVSPELMREQVARAVRTVDEGEGVLVLCDMFGGTPSNVCLSTECGACIEVVTGVNLPMLLKLATARSQGLTLEEAAVQIAAYGQRHIAHATAMLRQRRTAAELADERRPAHADGHAR